MDNVKISYEEAKKKLDQLFDVVEQTNIHQSPELFCELLKKYNAMDNFLWDIFHDEVPTLNETYNNH